MTTNPIQMKLAISRGSTEPSERFLLRPRKHLRNPADATFSSLLSTTCCHDAPTTMATSFKERDPTGTGQRFETKMCYGQPNDANFSPDAAVVSSLGVYIL